MGFVPRAHLQVCTNLLSGEVFTKPQAPGHAVVPGNGDGPVLSVKCLLRLCNGKASAKLCAEVQVCTYTPTTSLEGHTAVWPAPRTPSRLGDGGQRKIYFIPFEFRTYTRVSWDKLKSYSPCSEIFPLGASYSSATLFNSFSSFPVPPHHPHNQTTQPRDTTTRHNHTHLEASPPSLDCWPLEGRAGEGRLVS